jgi:peptidoglycan-associated lipoprotein
MALLLAVAIGGCKKKVETPPPPPPPPPKAATATISVSPSSIERGQSATLTWSTENAKTVTLQGATVAASGSQTVSPTQSTDYRVSAQGDAGTPEATSTARLTVTEPPPPPPPPPVHQASDDEIFSQSVHDIFFDFDKYDLRSESQTSLTQAAQAISQHPNWVVLIEGNCDERGSTEYNIGLGANRATSARDFLVKAGVNPNQLKTHSNGKEHAQECKGSEDCWQKDRNDHFSLQH